MLDIRQRTALMCVCVCLCVLFSGLMFDVCTVPVIDRLQRGQHVPPMNESICFCLFND